jgi:hypothetical protein
MGPQMLRVFVGVVLLAASQTVRAGEPTAEVEWRSCGQVSTFASTKSACYVVSLQNLETKFQFQLCAGVNISGGTIILGGGASTMMCATVDVPAGADKAQARRLAEKALKEKLNDPKTQAKLKEALGYNGRISGVGSLNLTDDAAKAAEIHKLLDEIDRVNRLRR